MLQQEVLRHLLKPVQEEPNEDTPFKPLQSRDSTTKSLQSLQSASFNQREPSVSQSEDTFAHESLQ